MNFDRIPDFAKRKSAIATALDGSLAGGTKRLSIKGGTFRYVSGGQEIGKIEDRFLDIVMVNAAPHVGRTFYAMSYDAEAAPAAPDCWSQDGKMPDAKVKNKQGENCLSCPKNAKGSGQGDSRACRFSQRLAVVLANDIGGEVLQLSLPATSLFGEGSKEAGATLQGYYKALSARSIDPAALITRARFDTDSATPKLGFTAMGWLSQEQYDAAITQGQSDAAQRAILMTVFEADGVDAGAGVQLPSGTPPVKSEPVAEKPKAAAKPASPPAAAPAADTAQVDEPLVRKADVAPATSATIAKLMEEWTDD